nr:SRPBCC family protein [Nocardioides daedukensis]
MERPRHDVHAQLVDLEHYPDWWPEVRAVASLGPDDARVLISSRLPWTLDLVLHAVSRELECLETTLSGDLDGVVRWRLEEAGEGTRLLFEQEVEVTGRLLGLASYAARPVLVWNHDRMVASAVARLRSAPWR